MADFEPILGPESEIPVVVGASLDAPLPTFEKPSPEQEKNHAGPPAESRCRERDDFVGLPLNMANKIGLRPLGILWVVFIFLHTELFARNVLKRFPGALYPDGSISTRGTLYSSVFMALAVVVCALLF